MGFGSCNVKMLAANDLPSWSPSISLRQKGFCNEHGTIYAISSDFGDRMTTQHLD